MDIAQELLKFEFSPALLKQSGQRVIPLTLSALNDRRIDQLHRIAEKVGERSFIFTGNNLIPIVFRKFKSFIKTNDGIFDRSELRTLTYSITYSEHNLNSIFSTENELNAAINLLNFHWRDSFLVGLIDCFLRNWDTPFHKSLLILEKFILDKLDFYNGSRKILIAFKENKRFFNTKNGDLVLGDTLARLNKSILDATKVLSVPNSWFIYPYFSKTIVTYFERNKNNFGNILDILNEVLLQHNNSITNKRLISKIIIQLEKSQDSELKDKIKRIAFQRIGDSGNITYWTVFENATEDEKSNLIKARNILNLWITQQFINVFFNVCINDERRKIFWLKLSSKISAFKVYGPMHTKRILKRDPRVSEYVDARFETVDSNRDVSAFILIIGKYMLIEFSNEGYAFYAYKINSPNGPNLKSRLNSIEDLRNREMPMLIQSEIYNEEGRLTHRDGNERWEIKFKSWMNLKVLR